MKYLPMLSLLTLATLISCGTTGTTTPGAETPPTNNQNLHPAGWIPSLGAPAEASKDAETVLEPINEYDWYVLTYINELRTNGSIDGHKLEDVMYLTGGTQAKETINYCYKEINFKPGTLHPLSYSRAATFIAKSHHEYLQVNGLERDLDVMHGEQPGKPKYTGTTITERANNGTAQTTGQKMVRVLENVQFGVLEDNVAFFDFKPAPMAKIIARQIVASYGRSPGHCMSMLDANVTHFGSSTINGPYYNANGRYFAGQSGVQVFLKTK
ncbi:hypothetical protein [Deinococcus aquaticus]|uniref:hypothetical protein n=1 Tax=Deinococcus aquaticus TaxID=328692 RepID=UPI003F473717